MTEPTEQIVLRFADGRERTAEKNLSADRVLIPRIEEGAFVAAEFLSAGNRDEEGRKVYFDPDLCTCSRVLGGDFLEVDPDCPVHVVEGD